MISKPLFDSRQPPPCRWSQPASFYGYSIFKTFYIIMLMVISLVGTNAIGIDLNPQGCVSGYNNQDLFPQKLTFEDGAGFTISYYKSYKVLNVTTAGDVYVLWQCGTPKPNVALYPTAIFIQIPINRVAIDSTTQIAFIEMLGERASIVYDGAGSTYISSPCLLSQIASGNTTEILIDSNTYAPSNYSIFTSSNIQVLFYSGYWNTSLILSTGTIPVFINPVETTPIAIFAWLQFISPFYNKEGTVETAVSTALSRYTCNQASIQNFLLPPDNLVKPVVLWASYSVYTTPPSWTVGSSGNYYQYLIQDAGGVFLTGFPQFQGLTDDQFVSLAKTADVWLYTDLNWSTVNQTVVGYFKSVINKQVFDFQLNGDNDWFENRLVEPDVLLEDIIDVLHPNLLPPTYQRIWWRNVFSQPIGVNPTSTVCNASDVIGSQHQVYAATCNLNFPATTTSSPPTNNRNGASRESVYVPLLFNVVLMLITILPNFIN